MNRNTRNPTGARMCSFLSLPCARAFWKVTDTGILHWVQVKWWPYLVHLVVSSCLKSKWKTILFLN